MKKRFSILVAFLFIFMVGFNGVKAEETDTDTTGTEDTTQNEELGVGGYGGPAYITTADKKYKISIDAPSKTGSTLTMKLGGEDYVAGDGTYYVYITDNKDLRPSNILEIDDSGCKINTDKDNVYPGFRAVLDGGKISVKDDLYMLKYNYVYVIKETTNKDTYEHYCEVSNNIIELEYPELPYGARYKIYVNTKNDISVFPQFPTNGPNGSHKLVVKIGLISNIDLLKKLSSAKIGLDEIIKYAKTATGTTYTISDKENSIDLKDFKITNGSYYYIYTTYDNSDGLYRDLSDIAIVMAKNDMLTNNFQLPSDLVSSGSNEEQKTESKKNVENPKTGNYISYTVGIIFIIVCGAFVFVLKNKKVLNK